MTWGKSTERLAATAQNAPGLDFFLPSQSIGRDPFPYRARSACPERQPRHVPGLSIAAGNGGLEPGGDGDGVRALERHVAVFVRMVVQSFERGEPDWLLTIFVVPCVLVGVAFAWLLIRALRIATGIGPTLVEISANPLVPGGEYDVYMSQAGRLSIKRLDLKLVCEETTTYRQGTNTRKATRRVYEQVLATCEQDETGGRRRRKHGPSCRCQPTRCTRSRPLTTTSPGSSSSKAPPHSGPISSAAFRS